MANEKIINSRIQNKVDTETNWTTAGQNGFIPKNGEFIIYKEDETHLQRRIKIGDGITPVHELPFITDGTTVETQLDDTIALTKIVPTNAAKYAEINELGGMTHKEEFTTEGTIISGPHTFSNLAVSIPAVQAPTGEFEYAVYLKNTGVTAITVQLNANASMWSAQGISLPADGEFHMYTGTSSFNYGQYDWTLEVLNDSYSRPENVEASTIVFYEVGGSTKVTEVLRPTVVTAIESRGIEGGVIDSIIIPAEVQALEGYGLGISADCHNYIDWEKKQYRQEVYKIRIDGSEEWRKSTAANIFQASTPLSMLAGDTKTIRPIISNGYGFSDWYNPDASIKPYFRIAPNANVVWIEATLEQFADAEAWKAYLAANPVEIVYPLATPIITDISDILGNNAIEVEAGGTLTFINENGYDVPSTINYYISDNTDTVYTGKFIGDVTGTAASAVCDGEGNSIADTYTTKSEVVDYANTARQEAISVANKYTDDIVSGSLITFYDAETIKNNIQISESNSSTYVENGYAYVHATPWFDIRAGIKVTNGVVELDYNVIGGGLNAGFSADFLIGEFKAEEGKEYSIPKTQIDSSDYESIYIYVTSSTSNRTIKGDFIETSSITNPESGEVYPIGYYDAFTFTAQKTETYRVWVGLTTNNYYWSTVQSGIVAAFSHPMDKYATKEYVDSKVTESSGTIVTTDGVAQSTWDTNTKVDKISTPWRLYGTGGAGSPREFAITSSGAANAIAQCDARGALQSYLAPQVDNDLTNKKYVDDHALTDSHKTILDFIASKIGTPNIVFGTDANGQLTAMSINDLAAAIMQALPAAEEGEF